MNPSALFGVAVRMLGLWFMASAVASLPAILVSPAAIIGLALNAAVGAILFFRADGFTRTAYDASGPSDSAVSD